MAEKRVILGVRVEQRENRAVEVQTVFTEFGCNIKTRIGLHDTAEGKCSPNGLIILEFLGTEDQCTELQDKLNKISGVEVKKMTFKY